MSDINFDIDKIVQFARISLSDDDKKNLESSLRSIIEYINKLMGVNVDGVEPQRLLNKVNKNGKGTFL